MMDLLGVNESTLNKKVSVVISQSNKDYCLQTYFMGDFEISKTSTLLGISASTSESFSRNKLDVVLNIRI